VSRAKQIVAAIIEQRAKGSELVARTVKTRLMLKGINVDQIMASSNDSPGLIDKLMQTAAEMNIKLPCL
jgi:hypothetical protein